MVVYNIKNGSASVFTNFLWALMTIIGFFNSMNTFIACEKAFA